MSYETDLMSSLRYRLEENSLQVKFLVDENKRQNDLKELEMKLITKEEYFLRRERAKTLSKKITDWAFGEKDKYVPTEKDESIGKSKVLK